MIRVIFIFALSFCVFASAYAEVTKEEKEEFRKLMEPLANKCMEELGIERDDLEEMKKKKDIDPCFMACMMKGAGVMTGDGMYSQEGTMDLAKPMMKSEEIREKMLKNGEICKKVNDEKVSDGEKGCERARLLMDCFKEQKDEMEILK